MNYLTVFINILDNNFIWVNVDLLLNILSRRLRIFVLLVFHLLHFVIHLVLLVFKILKKGCVFLEEVFDLFFRHWETTVPIGILSVLIMEVLEQNNFVLIIHVCKVDLSALVIIILHLVFIFIILIFIVFLLLILNRNSILLLHQLHGHLLLNLIVIFFFDVLATAEDLLLLLAFQVSHLVFIIIVVLALKLSDFRSKIIFFLDSVEHICDLLSLQIIFLILLIFRVLISLHIFFGFFLLLFLIFVHLLLHHELSDTFLIKTKLLSSLQKFWVDLLKYLIVHILQSFKFLNILLIIYVTQFLLAITFHVFLRAVHLKVLVVNDLLLGI